MSLDRGELRQVAAGIWVVDDSMSLVAGIVLPIRMTIIALQDGGLLLHSPVAYTPALAGSLAKLGEVRHLLAPNIAHWTMIAGWQRAFPEATVWAVPNLRTRSQVVRSGLRIDRDLDAQAPPEWAAEMDQMIVTAAGVFQEMALFHRGTRTLILVDLVQNLSRDMVPPLLRPLAWLLSAAAHDGRPPIYLRALVRMSRRAASRAAAQLVEWAPERVIFSHGDWFERDGTAALRHALRWLLPPTSRG